MDEVAPPSGVVVVDGYDLVIRVSHKRLEVVDGVASHRRVRRFHRATGRVRRVVSFGSSGVVTLEALRWLADVRAAYVQLDRRGGVVAAFGPSGTDRPSLRRAQALAGLTPRGLELSRGLVAAKLDAQRDTLQALAAHVAIDRALAAVADQRQRLARARSVEELRISEAWAAAAYWQALAPIEVRFARRDVARIPDHWRTVGSRSSPLANGPRVAATPAHAVVNYLAGCLAAEAVLAARTVGLDPGLGVLHADAAFRDSLAYDLVEPARPVMERVALELVAGRTFAVRDFIERRNGQCMLAAPLTHELVDLLPRWRQLMGRIAEDFAATLLDHAERQRHPVATPITGRHRAAGRSGGPRVSLPQVPKHARRCGWCGGPALPGRATCSDTCADGILSQTHEQFAAMGSERMRRFDRTNHPGLTPAARQKRSETRKAQRLAELAWEREHPEPVDREAFARDIAPKLIGMSANVISRATGLSVRYCGEIKRGERVPHPRHWEALTALTDIRIKPVHAPHSRFGST